MQVFPIKDNPALEAKYKGAGYAIGAAVDGRLIDFAYLADLADAASFESEKGIEALIADERYAPTVRYMQGLGEVFVGVCSCYEFVVV